MQAAQVFGRYSLMERIATGGMAEIFKAKLLGVMGFEKTVVIKRILPFWSERREFVTMLVDEAKILVHLNHPNIVQVIELGCEQGTYFIAMEFVDGVDLRKLISACRECDRAIPQEIAIFIVLQTLEGLHYAHERSLKEQGPLKIVHRDVSPQNILLSFDGEVKVTDFGIAKAMIKTHETQTGVLKGKYAYMSPEQALGAPLDARSDLFSAAIVLYELLFRRRLFAAGSDIETLDRVRQAEVPWPEPERTELFPGIEFVLARALSRNAADRFTNGAAFAAALRAVLPKDKIPDRETLRVFLHEIFDEEIRERRQREASNATASLARQTKVSPAATDGTVSLLETETEAESRVAKAVRDVPRRRAALLWGSAAVVAVLLSWIGIRNLRSGDGPETAPRNAILASTSPLAAAFAPPNVPTPPPSPEAVAPVPALLFGRLDLKASPPKAKIVARYSDVEEQGIGHLNLEKIPLGSQVQVRVELAGYEVETRSIEINQAKPDQQLEVGLQKKIPAIGSVKVQAVPWGRASMAGIFSGRETVYTHSNVPAGRYTVAVVGPKGDRMSASAVIRPGKQTFCTGDFNKKTFACR